MSLDQLSVNKHYIIAQYLYDINTLRETKDGLAQIAKLEISFKMQICSSR